MRRWLLLVGCSLTTFSTVGRAQTPGGDTPLPTPAASPYVQRDDGSFHDSIGFVAIRPLPDATTAPPPCIQEAEYLRKHNDTIMATAYLRRVIDHGDIVPQYRARAILDLADCLNTQNQKAESLCWLKIWISLYPSRPEFGAVAYRIATLYMQMGLPDLARDAFYLALAHTVNQGEVLSANDLKEYTRLTVATLWGLAANEYESGQWARAAKLFDRYRHEATTASSLSLEKAAYLQADCNYQLKLTDKAMGLYEETLTQHPFNPLAPQARLRLYHLYMVKHLPEKAQEDLEALAWTVRTVWPKDETYWQEQTAELLMALNQKNTAVLPPLLQGSSQLPPQGKTWQEALNHYDTLVSCEVESMQASKNNPVSSIGRHRPVEEDDLLALDRSINQLLPSPPQAGSNQ